MNMCPGLFGIDIDYLARGRGIKPQKVGRRKKSGRNGGGQKGIKKNDSIEQLLKANTQMLKILDALGIKAVQETDGEFDDEEL